MKVIILIVITLSLAADLFAGGVDNKAEGCFGRILSDDPIGDTITIFTTDNRIISGIKPLSVQSSAIYCRSVTERGTMENFGIAFDRIDRITYSKPSGIKPLLTSVGLVAGIIGGAFAGAEVLPDNSSGSFIDGGLIIGGMIGGLIGAACGFEIGNHITVKVNLECR